MFSLSLPCDDTQIFAESSISGSSSPRKSRARSRGEREREKSGGGYKVDIYIGICKREGCRGRRKKNKKKEKLTEVLVGLESGILVEAADDKVVGESARMLFRTAQHRRAPVHPRYPPRRLYWPGQSYSFSHSSAARCLLYYKYRQCDLRFDTVYRRALSREKHNKGAHSQRYDVTGCAI